jgi:hypothetical protein
MGLPVADIRRTVRLAGLEVDRGCRLFREQYNNPRPDNRGGLSGRLSTKNLPTG